MKISELSDAEWRARLTGDGIVLRTGPVCVRISTRIPQLQEAIRFLYRDYPVEEKAIAQLTVAADPRKGLRRFYRPQSLFKADGALVFLPLPYDFAIPLFEWGMNWCVHQHVMDHLVLHSAVLEREGIGLIIAGTSGAGKSTLCAALSIGGWRLLSDEMALVDITTGAILPNPRPIGLKDQSIDVIRRLGGESLPIGPSSTNDEKGTIAHLRPTEESLARRGESAQPKLLLFPKFHPDAQPLLTRVSRARAFFLLALESFNYSRLGLAGFETLSSMIDSIECYEVQYKSLEEAETLLRPLLPL